MRAAADGPLIGREAGGEDASHDRGATVKTPLDLAGYVDLDSRDDLQLFAPALTADGEPRLQSGECVVRVFDTIGAGIRSGLSPVRHAGGSMEEMDGRCFVTTTRFVFVCHRWDLGGDLRSARRARDGAADGQVDCSSTTRRRRPLDLGPRLLVGQVRWPWLASLTYSRASGCRDSLVEMRCVQAGRGRETSVFLSMVPSSHDDVDDIVASIVHAVRDDRLGQRGLCPDTAAELRSIEAPAARSRWTTVGFPGAHKRMASTATHGGHSAVTLAPWQDRLVDHIHV